jgi:glycosyltransferase involved in cell wall biosynthesis
MVGSDQMNGLRLFAALGPGDIVGARQSKIKGMPIKETSIAFSEQLFSYCRKRGVKTLAISSNSRIDQLKDGDIILENRPKAMLGGGIRFHVSQITYAFYLAARAHRFGADIALVDSGTTHYFALAIFRLLGIPVVVNLHNVLWPCGFPPAGVVARIVRTLNQLFFRYVAAGAIGVSPECKRQMLSESAGRIPFCEYRCQFELDGFKLSSPYKAGPFRIIFVGRVEINKGVFDVLEMAKALRTQSPVPVIFDLCGDGTALPALRTAIHQNGLTDSVTAHGRLERERLLQFYATSHAAIIPTRSNFTEGMPQVCAEAMLSNLPVITSQVANAFDVIGPATVAAETDNIESYVTSILSLVENQELYAKLRAECPRLSLQFLDRSKSFPAALDEVLCSRLPLPRLNNYDQLFAIAG